MGADLSARAFYDPVLVTEFVQKHFNFRDLSRRLSDQDRIKVMSSECDFFLCLLDIFMLLVICHHDILRCEMNIVN